MSSRVLLVFTLVGCSHYRSQLDNYKGIGAYKTPDQYDTAKTDADLSTDRDPASLALKTRSFPFAPKSPFRLTWPVREVKINRGFKPASDPDHHGLDLGGKAGTPIVAAHEGIVIYAGDDFRGYGNMVLIEYNSEWATLYAHMKHIIAEPGQIVEAGSPIGTMGKTGEASGVHLHFELLRHRQPIDPMPQLSQSHRFVRR